MKLTGFESNGEILSELGQRIRDTRIAVPLTREQLAKKSGVSERTLANIEAGQGATLDKLISVLRELGLAANLDALIPEQGIRPSDYATLGKKRQRASTKRASASKSPRTWKWGDEK